MDFRDQLLHTRGYAYPMLNGTILDHVITEPTNKYCLQRQGRFIPRRLNLSNIEEISESRSPPPQEPFTVTSPNSTPPASPARPRRRIPVDIVELEDSFFEPKTHTKSPHVQSPTVRTPSSQSPRVQSPAVKTPSVQSPRVYSPTVKTPSAQSPRVYSPTVKTPSVQSPRVYSPTVRTPSAQSPRVQSPAVRTPYAQSPRVQSPAVGTSYAQSLHVQSPAVGTSYAQSLHVQSPAAGAPYAQSHHVQTSSLGTPYVQSPRTTERPQDMSSFSWSKYSSPRPPTPLKYPTAARVLFPENEGTYCQTRSPCQLPTEKTPRCQFSNPPTTIQCTAVSPRPHLTTPRTQPHVPTPGTSTRRATTSFHASSQAPMTSEQKTEAVDEIIRKYQSCKDKSTKITAAPIERPYDKRAQDIMEILRRHRRDERVTPRSAGPLRSSSIQRIVDRYATPTSVYTNTVDDLRHYKDDGGEASGDQEATEEEELYEEYDVCGEEGDFDNGQKESAIKRFDLSVRAELKRRKDDPDQIIDILVDSPFSTRHEEGIGGPYGQALSAIRSVHYARFEIVSVEPALHHSDLLL
ncbi:unnamed protein product [Timema podura]|uniref:Uncharacterized protein n=1 Tax=Timema podura TaxID=61482 RepID=A0ABN7NSA8_TIMPD|nr:unnamed protein product [Timema podura]